jgi:hypothetical protein
MDLVGYGIQSWLPTYLINVRHVGITVTGALVTVPGVAGDCLITCYGHDGMDVNRAVDDLAGTRHLGR